MLYFIEKKDIPTTLRPFVGYDFKYGTWDREMGPTVEARSFCRKYINAIKKMFPECKVNLKANYWTLSGFIKNQNGKLVYLNICDIRYERYEEWAEHILIRTMAHEKDWTGGPNQFTNLRDIVRDVNRLF